MKRTLKNKKGVIGLGDLKNVALALLLTGVFFAIGLVVLVTMNTNINTSTGLLNSTGGYSGNTNALNINTTLTKQVTALTEIPNNWLVLLAVIVAASVVIGIVVTSLGGAMNRSN